MNGLIIIIVWYNEERNLPKLFHSLEYIKSKFNIRQIYVDQSSTDKSIEIAKKYWSEVYVHPNKWYADPDKKRAVEELCKDNDRILILDCDEELTKKLSDEIIDNIWKDIYKIVNINIESIILWWFGWKAYQPRLFKKYAMKITDEIHNYLIPKLQNIGKFKNNIRNDDLRLRWREIASFLEKTNRYGDIEIEKLQHLPKWKIILFMFWKPIQWFFWFGIIHKQFFRWFGWLILCMLHFCAQFLMYAKLYEKRFIHKK